MTSTKVSFVLHDSKSNLTFIFEVTITNSCIMSDFSIESYLFYHLFSHLFYQNCTILVDVAVRPAVLILYHYLWVPHLVKFILIAHSITVEISFPCSALHDHAVLDWHCLVSIICCTPLFEHFVLWHSKSFVFGSYLLHKIFVKSIHVFNLIAYSLFVVQLPKCASEGHFLPNFEPAGLCPLHYC